MGDLMVGSSWWLVEAVILLILGFGISGRALHRYRAIHNLDIIPRPVRFNQTFFNANFRDTVQAALRLRAERFVSASLALVCLGMFAAGQPWPVPLGWRLTLLWAALTGLDALWVGVVAVKRV